LGHNILYITIGLVWLYFVDDGMAEETTTIRKGHGGHGLWFSQNPKLLIH